ncbi:MAG: DUF4340 domain-containing protein [Elusimicrobiota bacterium]|jgi:hypothetical protein
MDLPALVKRLAWVCAGVTVLAGLYLAFQLPRQRSLFAGKMDRVVRIHLQLDSSQLDLTKQEKEWSVGLSTGPRFPADPDKVTRLKNGLGGIQIEERISSRADRAGDFDVTVTSGLCVRLYGKNNKLLAEGLFGKQAPDFTHIYFRYPGRPAVYLARGIIRGELGEPELGSWRRRQLISFPEAKIQAIQIKGPGYQTSLAQSSGVWTVDGKPANPAPVYGLVGVLSHLQADGFADFVSVTFDQLTDASIHIEGNGQSADLRIGSLDPKTKRYLVSAGPTAGLAWLTEDKIKSLLLKSSAFQPKKP